jgi:hypothetical protein
VFHIDQEDKRKFEDRIKIRNPGGFVSLSVAVHFGFPKLLPAIQRTADDDGGGKAESAVYRASNCVR